ncbi:MAG: hypothetical protein ACI9P3_006141 [Bradyrhizobium sp.]
MKGEALAPPAGRADDFAWPRREIGREQAKGDVPVAAATPAAPAAGAPANPPPSTTAIAPDGSIITAPKPQKRVFRPAQAQPQQQPQPWLRDFFGFGAPQQRPLLPPPPRPPRSVGQRAAGPGDPWQ